MYERDTQIHNGKNWMNVDFQSRRFFSSTKKFIFREIRCREIYGRLNAKDDLVARNGMLADLLVVIF